ncbi:MAG: hypothetical protein V1863_05205, partial [Candidatus Omnitrophota bacterium]
MCATCYLKLAEKCEEALEKSRGVKTTRSQGEANSSPAARRPKKVRKEKKLPISHKPQAPQPAKVLISETKQPKTEKSYLKGSVITTAISAMIVLGMWVGSKFITPKGDEETDIPRSPPVERKQPDFATKIRGAAQNLSLKVAQLKIFTPSELKELRSIYEKIANSESLIEINYDTRLVYTMMIAPQGQAIKINSYVMQEFSDFEIETILLHESVHLLSGNLERVKRANEIFVQIYGGNLLEEKTRRLLKKASTLVIENEFQAHLAELAYRKASDIRDLKAYFLAAAQRTRFVGIREKYQMFASLVGDDNKVDINKLIKEIFLYYSPEGLSGLLPLMFQAETGRPKSHEGEYWNWVIGWFKHYSTIKISSIAGQTSSSPARKGGPIHWTDFSNPRAFEKGQRILVPR